MIPGVSISQVARSGADLLLQFPTLAYEHMNLWAEHQTKEKFCLSDPQQGLPTRFNENFRMTYRWTFAFSPFPGFHTFFLDHLPTGKSMGFKVARDGSYLGFDRPA